MRIVILTDSQDRHLYFCNRIIAECDGVVGVFLGTKINPKSFLTRIKELYRRRIVMRTIFNKFINLIFLPYGRRFQKEKKFRRHFFLVAP